MTRHGHPYYLQPVIKVLNINNCIFFPRKIKPVMTFNSLWERLLARVQTCVFKWVPVIRFWMSPPSPAAKYSSLKVFVSARGLAVFKCLKSWCYPYLTQITAITAGSRPRAWEGRTETPQAPGVSREGRILSQTYTYTDVFHFINVLLGKQRARREASLYFRLMG